MTLFKIEVHHYFHGPVSPPGPTLADVFERINKMNSELQAFIEAQTTANASIKASLTNIATDEAGQTAKIDELLAGAISDEQRAALTALKTDSEAISAAAKTLADAIPDAPVVTI